MSRPRYLFLSHTAEVGPFRVGSHHLSRALARRGSLVVHVSTPLSLANLWNRHRRADIGLRARSALRRPELDEGGCRLSVVPLTIVPIQLTATLALRQRVSLFVPSLKQRVYNHLGGPPDFMVVDQPLFAGAEDYFAARRVIYRPTDVYTEGLWSKAQQRLVARANGVVATSQPVLDNLRLPGDKASMVLPNGVDMQRFTRTQPHRREGAVYVGALDDRFDWEWLRNLAAMNRDVSITVAGTPPRQVPSLPANVSLVGPVPYDELPALLGRHRVGLLPFKRTALNDGRSPMKLYEYMASGLTVLATDVRTVASSDAAGLFVARSISDATRMLREALELGSNDAGRAIAARMDWEQKADDLEAFCLGLG